MNKRLTIFANFSDPTVPAYVLYHLGALRKLSSKLIFASNSPISESSWAELNAVCDLVVERSNKGYDFAAWRDVILAERMSDWHEVLLTNSSVIGPLFDLSPMFEEMQSRACDFWGLTHSVNVQPHIQSYFVCFRSRLTTAPVWEEFWRRVDDKLNKRQVIRKYEVQFKTIFESHGFVGDTYLPQMRKSGMERVFFRRLNSPLPLFVVLDKNRTNPTIHSPLELIESGLPYLKASLLWGHNRRQPFPLQKIMALKNVDYDWSLLGLDHRR
jgi:lipopolysaccharide biosynthesis protein